MDCANPKESSLAETTHLKMFSDGVFTIIITLLVLEIHRPTAVPGKLAEELLKEWHSSKNQSQPLHECSAAIPLRTAPHFPYHG
jgi:hypothetical protein